MLVYRGAPLETTRRNDTQSRLDRCADAPAMEKLLCHTVPAGKHQLPSPVLRLAKATRALLCDGRVSQLVEGSAHFLDHGMVGANPVRDRERRGIVIRDLHIRIGVGVDQYA